jgi:hypothetical protein
MPRGGRPQALTTWEKRYAVKLVTVGGLDSAAKATKVDVYIETVRNALKEAGLGSARRFQSLLCLPSMSKRG